MSDEVVDRLYQALVEELRRRGHPEDRPIRVSELYQSIIPYRAVRSILDVELNADYEHALLRLLAGERDLLRLDSPDARAELEREVGSPYPDVGRFREFAGAAVRVSFHAADGEPGGPGQPGEPGEPSEPTAGADDDPDERAVRLTSGPGPRVIPARGPIRLHESEAATAPPSDPVPGPEPSKTGGACVFCGEALPEDPAVRFCPYCGGDQGRRPCLHCDTMLERGWRYCISCGNPG